MNKKHIGIKRENATKILNDLVNRIPSINDSLDLDKHPHIITKVIVYGSYVNSDKDKLGDIDIVYGFVSKFNNMYQEICFLKQPHYYNISNTYHYSERLTHKALRNKSKAISIHFWLHDFESMQKKNPNLEYKVIYELSETEIEGKKEFFSSIIDEICNRRQIEKATEEQIKINAYNQTLRDIENYSSQKCLVQFDKIKFQVNYFDNLLRMVKDKEFFEKEKDDTFEYIYDNEKIVGMVSQKTKQKYFSVYEIRISKKTGHETLALIGYVATQSVINSWKRKFLNKSTKSEKAIEYNLKFRITNRNTDTSLKNLAYVLGGRLDYKKQCLVVNY